MLAPKPVRILDPEKCICEWVESGAGGRYWVSAQSTRKSAKVEDRVRSQRNGPFCHPAGCIPAAYDLGERGSTYDRDGVLLKVGLELLGGEVHAIAHLLIVWVILLRGGEHFTQIIYRPLD